MLALEELHIPRNLQGNLDSLRESSRKHVLEENGPGPEGMENMYYDSSHDEFYYFPQDMYFLKSDSPPKSP